MRGKGEGAVYRVPKDLSKPLKYWTAVLELPSADGTRRRKVIRRKSKSELLTELGKARADLEKRGDLPTKTTSVEQWFTYWLGQAAKEVRPATMTGYRSTVTNHIIPGLGPKTKLDKITAATVRKVHDRILDKGLTSTYALNAHRIMSASFEVAVKEGRIGRNPAALTAAPRKNVPQLDVLDLPESLALLQYTLEDPERVRWATFLLTAARRGEVLGLERDRIGDVIDLSWQLQRITYSHGCKSKCGFKRGVDCPDRKIVVPADYEYRQVVGGLYWTRPKSRKGWRVIPLVDPLRSILERHLATAPENKFGLVFARPDGRPYDPDQDTAAWRAVMKSQFGDDRSVRLHDLRHTTVDLLYLAGVPEDLIQEIVGHSTRSMSREYKSRGNIERLTRAMEKMSLLFTPPAPEHTHEIGA